MNIEQILGEAHCDKGANEQNLEGGANVTEVPIIDRIDKFIVKKGVKKGKKQ